MKSWIKQNNDPETTLALIERYPPAFLLLTQIAQRARRKKALFDDLDIGEAKIGDFQRLGMSENQYRKAKELLEGNGLATFRGTRKGTIAKLCGSNIYDINHEQGGGQSDTKGTDRGRTGDGQGTSNQEGEEGKKEKKKEKTEFQIWLENEFEDLTKYRKPLREEKYNDFVEKWGKNAVHQVMEDLSNKLLKGKPGSQNYTDANRTLNSWLKKAKDFGNLPKPDKPQFVQ